MLNCWTNHVTHNIMGIYGKLLGKTGSDIVLKGNADNLYMTGDLNITDGRVLIVPQYKVAYNLFNDNFVYKVILDSSILLKDANYIMKYNDSLSGVEKSKLDPLILSSGICLTQQLKKTNLAISNIT